MKKIRRVRSRRRAFTLLEVLMVIVILGVLAALIVPQFTGTERKAKIDLTSGQINGELSSKLELFKMHCGRYPTTEEGLTALINKPDDEEISSKWGGPYVKDVKDAWGRELKFESPGQVNETSFDISSSGPDGKFGNDDDITNWQKK